MLETSILIVDDETRMRKLIKDFLVQKGHNILEAEDGEKAIEIFEDNKNKINLILLDVMMPKLDGWSVLRKIRQVSSIPVIMLTARGEEQDELFGFELGVDEYITKPFSPKILVARVEAILKRAYGESNELKDYGGIVLDEQGRTVKVDGKDTELSLREFELLKYLSIFLYVFSLNIAFTSFLKNPIICLLSANIYIETITVTKISKTPVTALIALAMYSNILLKLRYCFIFIF